MLFSPSINNFRNRPYMHRIQKEGCILLLLFTVLVASICHADTLQRKSYDGLRGVYLGSMSNTEEKAVVGRLALELFKNNQFHDVRLDHNFQSKDQFRFKVSSNQAGWLYILHRDPHGEPQLLWPPVATQGDNQNINYINENTTYSIPSAPGILVFDEEVGNESFYIAIRSRPVPPALTTFQRQRPQHSIKAGSVTAPKKPNQRIVQFSVRGPADTTDAKSQGIIFDPGTEDNDPNVYFSSTTTDKLTLAMIEFKLRHTKK